MGWRTIKLFGKFFVGVAMPFVLVAGVCSEDKIVEQFATEVRRQANLVEGYSSVFAKHFDGKWWASEAYVKKWTSGIKSVQLDTGSKYEDMRKEWFFRTVPSILTAMNPSIKARDMIDPIEYIKVYNFYFSMPDSDMVYDAKRKSALERALYNGFSAVNLYPSQELVPIGEGDEQSIKRKFVGLMKCYESYDMNIKPMDRHEAETLSSAEVDKYFTGETETLFRRFFSVIKEESHTRKIVGLFNRELSGSGDASLGVWRIIGGGRVGWISVLPDDNDEARLWVGLMALKKDTRPSPILFSIYGIDGKLIRKIIVKPSVDDDRWKVDYVVKGTSAQQVGALELSSVGK